MIPLAQKLIVGLGNPGREYEGTRHNIGFEILERFAQSEGIRVGRKEFRALCGDGVVGACRVYLLEPMTFMNLSGESATEFLRRKPMDASDILVIADDLALPLGKLRLRAGGSAGGHNGLKSMIAHLHSQDFPRLRFGVGGPPHPDAQIDYVLGRFSRAERREMEEPLDRAVAAIYSWLADGIEKAMNTFNG